jgi:signal transduction histidine kinase
VDEESWKRELYGVRDLPPAALESRDTVQLRELGSDSHGVEAAYFLRHGFRSYLGFPLIAKDQAVGILSFYLKETRGYDDEEVDFLRGLAGQTAVAIHNSMLYEQTRRQAIELEKANQVKEDFLSVMSHELRTPLNVISGYSQLLQEGVLGAVSPEQHNALDKIMHHSNELLSMVNSIMNATKIEAGAVTVEREEFPLANLLDEIRLLYDYPLGKNVVLEWDYPADLPVMFTDRAKLKQILQNLINNAVKFTDEGRVTLRARRCPDASRAELTVSDAGVGIAAEQIPQIFDRFRQLDGSRTRGFGGVGLGLHIVKSFTELLGGEVTVRSAPGQGSTFTIVLPCVYPTPTAPAVAVESSN